ncbi:MAG TPA: hypothetical protein VIF14_07245 [Alphaproteobacteria bacterium]
MAAKGHRRVTRCLPAFGSIGRKRPVEVAPPLYSRALVVFSGRTGVPWLRWLRRGFRHCFVAVDDGVEWLTIDPLLHRLEVRASGLASDFDLAREYRQMDLVVLEVVPAPMALRAAPPGLFTCVETAKRLLGIRAWRVLTPWQLYRFLRRAGSPRTETQAAIRPARELPFAR